MALWGSHKWGSMTDDIDADKKVKKVSTTVYLEPQKAEALRALSKITCVPQQVYLRRGLDAILRDNIGLLPPESAGGFS